MKFNREDLFRWRHLDINSDLLLSVVALSAEEIISFSVRHRLHVLDMFEYTEVLLVSANQYGKFCLRVLAARCISIVPYCLCTFCIGSLLYGVQA